MSETVMYPKALFKGGATGLVRYVDDVKAERSALKDGYEDLSTLPPEKHDQSGVGQAPLSVTEIK